MTLRQLVDRRGATHAEHHYLEDARSERVVTYAELSRRVNDWLAVLDQAQVPVGASVLLDIDDPLEFATTFLGVIAAGRCAVPIDPAMPDGEFARAIDTLQPTAVIGSGRSATGTIIALAPDARPTPDAAPSPATEAGRVRLRTSGSTGEPKIVELTEAQLLHVASAVAEHNALTPADRGFNPLPLFHINGEVVALLASLVAGASLVLDRRFHRDGFWTVVTERQITWINAVPAILTILSREPIPTRPAELRFIRSASASLAVPVREKLADVLGEIIVESYGMTEAASQITATSLEERPPTGSAGRPVGVELEVRDDEGQPAGTGQIGHVWLRGPGVVTAYVGGRAAERFDDAGWLNTGDIGHLDNQGYLYLAGRTDDVINRGGQLVYPREIEEVLLADDAVLDAIVVGRPDEILGAVPIAYVIARPDSATNAESLTEGLAQRCREHLSRYKRPAVIELVDDLPRAATGKIRRHEVQQAAIGKPLADLGARG